MATIKKISLNGTTYDLGGGLTEDVKQASLQIAEKVAYIDEHGQDYYDELYTAFYDNMWNVTNTLSNAVNSNPATKTPKDGTYTAIISASAGYTLEGATVSVTMNGANITSSVYNNGTISIPTVTGDVVITVVAVALTVVSISAVYTQSGTVYDTDTLDSLKADLVVTATFNDSSTEVVPSADYTLTGTLTAGTSTVTVEYSNEVTTFNVVVESWTVEWDYTENSLPSDAYWTSRKVNNGSYPTITFESGKGIKWVGNGWSQIYSPKNYQYSSKGVMEATFNFDSLSNQGSARVELASSADALIMFMTSAGIRINAGSATPIPNTIPVMGTDYTLRIEKNGTTGKAYLNNVLLYDGETRNISSEYNSSMIATTATTGSVFTAYIKAIRFKHIE